MRAFGVALMLLCLLVLAGADEASAQQVLGPFCLQVGTPVNAAFTLLVAVITPTQFQVVGSVFGDVPVNGAGLLNASNQSRFFIIAGATAATLQGAPISITGTLDLNSLSAPGSGFCFGGSNCGTGAPVVLQLC